ncbi:hypothetical protein [Streptomyces sp. H51]
MHGGVCAALLDSVAGCAVHSALPEGAGTPPRTSP